jgi:hypothetical protein
MAFDRAPSPVRGIAMVAAIIGASATILVAIITYALTYVSSRRLSLWQKRLERTNNQLKDFYGPLLALSETSDRTWKLLSGRYGHSRERIAREENGDLWVLWVTEIFQPINKKMSGIIIEHADLLKGDSMPECLLNFCAHASGYDAIIKRWQSGNRTEMYSIADWPKDLNEYLETSFSKLKEEQQDLIGRLNKTSRWKTRRDDTAGEPVRTALPAGEGRSGGGEGGHDDQRQRQP